MTKREDPSRSPRYTNPKEGHKGAKEQIVFKNPHQSQETYRKRKVREI